MKLVILCGGIGSRMKDYSLPKPLNMIYGKPAIYYVLKNIPEDVKDLYFIYGIHLKEYNFEEIIINLFKTKKCHFSCVEYLTRGPVETAYIGLQGLEINSEESITFIDNDNIYRFPESFFEDKAYNFLGTSIDESGSTQYSFVHHKENEVFEIVEKERISNTYCCGVYGFQNKQSFQKAAEEVLRISKSLKKHEIYMSDLFRYLLETKEKVQNIPFTNQGNHIGSLQELESSLLTIQMPKMRICFDLDNTLVTYPTVAGDYTSVKPIEKTIALARELHAKGHTIIIHTARRMETHKYNVGAVIKDIGRITFDTLEKFQIPYDEILFGKPLADIYIDDRAINPCRGDYTYMGLFDSREKESIVNKLPNNKYNEIELKQNKIVKKGPYEIIKGEHYVYSELQKHETIREYFPTLYRFTKEGEQGQLEIEYVKGIPLYFLFRHNLVYNEMIIELINILEQFHNVKGSVEVSKDLYKKNYIKKLKERFECREDYPFEDASKIQNQILERLEAYTDSDEMQIVPFIHGDFWFSNIIYTYERKWKCFDMKGLVDGILTVNGDPLYDYAKLYQSLLGFDLVMWDDYTNYSKEMRDLVIFFEKEVEKRGISVENLKTVTYGLIIGTLHAVSIEKKEKIWTFLKGIFMQ